jgi:hypothetical protein
MTIGVEQARNGSNNRVFGITASTDEYRSYIKLVTRSPEIARTYVVYFGDIYLTNPHLLPRFDVATLFHLCEFSKAQTSERYGGLSDRDLLDLMTDKVLPRRVPALLHGLVRLRKSQAGDRRMGAGPGR